MGNYLKGRGQSLLHQVECCATYTLFLVILTTNMYFILIDRYWYFCGDPVSCYVLHHTYHITRYAHTRQFHYSCHFRRDYCSFYDCHHHPCCDRDCADCVAEVEGYASLYQTVITLALISSCLHSPRHRSESLKCENGSQKQSQLVHYSKHPEKENEPKCKYQKIDGSNEPY